MNLTNDMQKVQNDNFSATMLHIEQKLGITKYSKNKVDRDLHFFIRGVLIQYSKNIARDMLELFDK